MTVSVRLSGVGHALTQDRYAFRHSGGVPTAVAAFEEATFAFLAHRPEMGTALDRALAADPDFLAALGLRGLAEVIQAQRESLAAARRTLASLTAAMRRRPPTPDEAALAAALAEAVEGRLVAAADRLEERLALNPLAIVLVKLAHAFRFMRGDLAGMARTTGSAVRLFTPDTPGYGFALGCHAFCLEEAGHWGEAERTGRLALAYEPADTWGLHAVAHVYEMTGRSADGIDWLEATRPIWRGCDNTIFHMAWHLALFHLEQGEVGRVLALYDAEVRPEPTDNPRDIEDAASLLWRLRQEGVDVGDRWGEIAEIARRRRDETTLLLMSLHYLLALVATGDRRAEEDLLAAVGACAAGDQAAVAAVAADVARILAGRGPARATPEAILAELRGLGGSNAQRDVFVRSLALAAAGAGDREAASRVLAVRSGLKAPDRFAALAERLGAGVDAAV